MLSYTSLVTEDIPMWMQTFNITIKNTNGKTSLQFDQENNTESINRNMHGNGPEAQHINQSVNQHQVETGRLYDIADQ